jgi:hypothetical protein
MYEGMSAKERAGAPIRQSRCAQSLERSSIRKRWPRRSSEQEIMSVIGHRYAKGANKNLQVSAAILKLENSK